MSDKGCDSERRRSKRFQAKGGVVALFSNGTSRTGIVRDVSQGGIGLNYINSTTEKHDVSTVTIFADRLPTFFLRELPCSIAYEREEIPGNELAVKRCGVRFGELTKQQLAYLEYFMSTCTLGEV